MKTRIILEINDGFRVDREVLEAGSNAIVIALTNRDANRTEAKIASIGEGGQKFFTNFAACVVSVIDKMTTTDDPKSPLYIRDFMDELASGLNKVMDQKAEAVKADLRRDLRERGVDNEAIEGLFDAINRAALTEAKHGK